MTRAVRAEWTKLLTMPGVAWSLLGAVGLTVGLGVLVTAATRPSSGCNPGDPCLKDLALLSLSGVTLGQVGVILVGVAAASAEYETMMIRSTLAAQPRRGAVLLAKAVVVTAVALGAGLLAVAGSLLAGRQILSGNGFTAAGYPPLTPADEPTLRAAFGTVLYFGLVGLLGLGIAAVLRHAAAAVSTAMAVLYLPTVLVLIIPMTPHVRDLVTKYSPMSAGLAVRATVKLADSVPIGPWAGLGVLAAYTCGSLLLGYALLSLRDA